MLDKVFFFFFFSLVITKTKYCTNFQKEVFAKYDDKGTYVYQKCLESISYFGFYYFRKCLFFRSLVLPKRKKRDKKKRGGEEVLNCGISPYVSWCCNKSCVKQDFVSQTPPTLVLYFRQPVAERFEPMVNQIVQSVQLSHKWLAWENRDGLCGMDMGYTIDHDGEFRKLIYHRFQCARLSTILGIVCNNPHTKLDSNQNFFFIVVVVHAT